MINLKNYSKGLICYVGGEFNPIMFLYLQNKISEINEFIKIFKNIFDNDFLFEIQRINDYKIDEFENEFLECANQHNIPIIGSNNVKFEKENDYDAHDALLCIAQKSTINKTDRITSNSEIYFKSSTQMIEVFKNIPNIFLNSYDANM